MSTLQLKFSLIKSVIWHIHQNSRVWNKGVSRYLFPRKSWICVIKNYGPFLNPPLILILNNIKYCETKSVLHFDSGIFPIVSRTQHLIKKYCSIPYCKNIGNNIFIPDDVHSFLEEDHPHVLDTGPFIFYRGICK